MGNKSSKQVSYSPVSQKGDDGAEKKPFSSHATVETKGNSFPPVSSPLFKQPKRDGSEEEGMVGRDSAQHQNKT